VQKIGNYAVKKFLGSLSIVDPSLPARVSKGLTVRRGSGINLFVNEIFSIREILDFDKDFQVTPIIKLNLTQNIEFYRVALVADFFHEENCKFNFGTIQIDLISNPNLLGTQIYSISPLRVDEKVQVTKEYALSPELKFIDVSTSIGSYTYKKEYYKLHPQLIGHFSKNNCILGI